MQAPRVLAVAFALAAWSAHSQVAASAPTPAAAPSAARPQPTPVSGRFAGAVLDANRQPLAGALVLARGSVGASVSTRTDKAGAFALELKERGPYALYIDAPGHAPRSLPKQAPATGLKIALERGLAVHGVVLDGASRQPVAGARVVASESTRALGPSWEAGLSQRRATTDGEGRFRIDGVGRGFLDLTASAPGQGGARARNVRAGERSELLVLLPMGALEGLVLDGSGQPVAGAAVRLEPSAAATTWATASAVSTDDEGRFAQEAIAPGSWRVLARATGLAPAWAAVEVERGAIASVQLRLAAPHKLRGRLVDDRQGPVARGRVEWLEHDGVAVPDSLAGPVAVRAASDGTFSTDGLPPGRHRLEGRAPGFVPESFEISIVRGDADAGDVRLARGLTIRGIVRGPDGRPVADARVAVDPGPRPFPVDAAETTTEADGRFVLPGLVAGTVRIAATADGVGRASASAETGAEDVVLTLKPWGAIRGVVVDERQQPVPAFRVEARTPDFRGRRAEEVADASGAFELSEVEAGTYMLEARAPGRVKAALPAVEVGAGATTDVGRLVLAGGGLVTGTVVDKAGAPIAGAEVTGRQGQRFSFGDEAAAVSDAAGSFELAGFATGAVQLGATHPLYAPAQVSVAVDPAQGPTEAKLTLSTGGRIEGRLSRRDGTPLVSGRVNVMPVAGGLGAGGLAMLTPDADGRFVAERVPPGRVRVTWLKGEGGRFESAQSSEVEVEDGQTASVELISSEIRISGHVTRAGQPVPGVRVQLSSNQSMRIMMVTAGDRGGGRGTPEPGVTREDGSYETTFDQPGTARVSLSSADGRTNYPGQNVQIPDVEAHVLELMLPGAMVRGSVVDGEGRPIEATVVASKKGGASENATAQSGPDGRFELGVEPGDWGLSGRAMGYAASPLEVSVPESGLDDVRLVLAAGRRLRGRVVGADGRGVAGARVGVRAPGVMQPWVESGPDGRFEVAGVPDAPISVSASTALGDFGLQSGIRPFDAEVVLRLRPGARLRARVVREDGSPAAGAFVSSRLASGAIFLPGPTPTSDAAGRTELWIPAGFGRVEVHASVPANSPAAVVSGRVELEPAEGQEIEAEIVLKPSPSAPKS